MAQINYTVSRVIEAEVVDIDEIFVLVYGRFQDDPSKTRRVIMQRADLARFKPRGLDDFKNHTRFKGNNQAYAQFVTHEELEKVRNGALPYNVTDRDRESKVVWGQRFPAGEVIYFCGYDHSIFDRSGDPLERATPSNFFLDARYDIEGLCEASIDDPSIIVTSGVKYGHKVNPIYYVPGNGHTVDLSFRLPEGKIGEWQKLDMYHKQLFLEEHTALGRFRRPEELREERYEDD